MTNKLFDLANIQSPSQCGKVHVLPGILVIVQVLETSAHTSKTQDGVDIEQCH